MDTHIEKTAGGPPSLFDALDPRPGGWVLTICGVTVDRAKIVKREPGCSWCARKLEETATKR